MSPNPEYVLGDGQRELQRLALQAQYWGGATLELLKRARIGPGMRVLDLGSGAGDVSLLAATLVGSSGSIVGIDRSPAAVEAARAKVEAAGLANVEFHATAIEDFATDRPFDALIGRFVLVYFSDPVATLRQLLPLVRSRGVVAFLEMDIDAARTVPRVPVVETAIERLRDTFRRAGVPVDFGPQVWRIFRAAGLPEPALIVRSKVEPAPALAGTQYIAETVRSLLPMMERLGVASAAEVEIETLADRMQEALSDVQASLLSPAVVGTWSTVTS